MISRNLKIELDDAQPDMTLGEAVLDGRGGTLLPTGTVLTASILTSLGRRGIDTITVVNDAISENDLRLERQRVEERLAYLLRGVPQSSATRILHQSILMHRVGEIS